MRKIVFFSLVNIILCTLLLPFLFSFYSSLSSHAGAQLVTEDMITYNKQSNFIKEFKIPNNLQELGLKGIATDSQGNAWFYHATNKTSTIIKFDPENENFTQYNVGRNTVVDNAIINLAGGQLIFDNERGVIWFTDARTNSIGKLDTRDGKIELVNIPTPSSGPMGITLSPDGKSVWFTEIAGNKISSLDIESNRILEYPTGGESGPTLLTFDSTGMLWVTQSYSNNILQVQPWMLVPNSTSGSFGMFSIALPKPDIFSPFGIALIDRSKDNETNERQKILFVSDHSSSRVILSDNVNNITGNSLQSYISYWTSPSQKYPATLPSQIVADRSGENIYFPQHGGNRISKINLSSGIMTEYDIPTGPLSTAVFIAVSDDGKRVWFTEWASNKVGYLDNTIKIPLDLELKNKESGIPKLLRANQPEILNVQLNTTERNNYSSSSSSSSSSALTSFPLSLKEVELSVIGMTDSGLKGITYEAQPQRIDMEKNSTAQSRINLHLVQQGIRNNIPVRLDHYTTMVKASAPEKGQLLISILSPVVVKLDLPAVISTEQSKNERQDNEQENQGWIGEFIGDLSFRNIVRPGAISTAVGLIGYIIYMRIKRSKSQKK